MTDKSKRHNKEMVGSNLDRRAFGKAAVVGAMGAGALLTTSGCGESQTEVAEDLANIALGRPPMTWAVKHSMQIGSSMEAESLQLARQLGMGYVNTWASPSQYSEIVAKADAAGLSVSKIGNGSIHNEASITLNLPGRDKKIEEFKENLYRLSASGIKYQTYAHMANGINSSSRETARGDASCRAFQVGTRSELESYDFDTFTYEKSYSEQEIWDNYEYFIKQIVPVAEETGVKIGIHPDDPPGLRLGNVPRPIFSSFEGYKRALEIADSPNVGMCLCTGCWLEGGPAMGKNVLETIDYFGGLKKLFIVHFRNVNQPLPHFHETFLNEGYMDMYKVTKQLRKVGFDGVLIADHWPDMVGGRSLGQVYSIGYIQGLIERANEEVLS